MTQSMKMQLIIHWVFNEVIYILVWNSALNPKQTQQYTDMALRNAAVPSLHSRHDLCPQM